MSSEGARPAIVVVGSINMDLVARCSSLPQPGQTLTASAFAEIPGGKGANQAVAASRAGGAAALIGRVGDDGFAKRLRENLAVEGVDIDCIQRSANTSSGVALITVADDGENQIVVVPGANGCVTSADVDRFAERIRKCDTLLLQLETPLETVVHAIRLAKSAGVRVILDPAPAPREAPPDALFDVDLICPNETEAAALTGLPVDSPEAVEAAARQLHARGAASVVITLGDRGCALLDAEEYLRFDACPVTTVDTTAAGDAFAAALAVRWAETQSLRQGIQWGAAAGALAASRPGAQPSLPTRNEITQLADRHWTN